ncbi:hypothetical protein N7456_002469 [Penicillium angulare]|uniref:Uncharacterized protein n=1 Tax=Penicillium angulare TaxID=116970 RepID=A0A9W9G859_9EURO|nr:hypothetical protein N7456_002469 [Penicillium angulare]
MLRRPKPCLPDPERFIGTDVKFDAWSASIKAKLAIDGEAIGNSKAQFFYVYLCLDSIAQRAVLPQLDHANDVNRYNYRAILDQLKILYDKPDGVPRATIHTSSRKQGSPPTIQAEGPWGCEGQKA